jgi:chemotaxis protein MotB
MSTVFKVMLLAVLAVGVVGCASTKMKQENEQLKAQVNKLSDALAASEDESRRLKEENVGVSGELSKTKAEYAAKESELQAVTKKLQGQGFEVSMREGVMTVTLPQKLLYTSGSADLTKSGRDKLATLGKTLNADLKGFPVEVQGHTDNEPIHATKDKYKSNWELSYDRAQTVAYSLIKSGIESKRIHVSAYGEFRPVAANTTNDGKARNRRVEIVVMQPAAGQ